MSNVSKTIRRGLLPPLPISLSRVAGMTLAEAAAVAVYIAILIPQQGNRGVYAPVAVGAGGVLLLGLFLEDSIAIVGTVKWNGWHALGLAVTEVVVWTQWANIVLGGLWSARGIGPGFVVLTSLLVLQHGAENALMGSEQPFQLRHIVTASVEAMAATVGWVLFVGGHPLAAVAALVGLFTVEHMMRLTAPAYRPGSASNSTSTSSSSSSSASD